MIRRSVQAPIAAAVKEEALLELREVLLGLACQLVATTGDDTLAEKYLGISLEDYSLGSMPDGYQQDLATLDLERFWIAKQISSACSFALQVGTNEERLAFGDDDWNDLAIFLEGAPCISFGGEPTPLYNEDSTLRRTLEMALARMTLLNGNHLTIRQLSLLAGIGETAVRTSLSADGIKTEGKPAQVDADVAEPWLQRRRGFVSTLTEEAALEADNATFQRKGESALTMEIKSFCQEKSIDRKQLANRAQVDAAWLDGLLTGDIVDADVEALCRIAKTLDIEAAPFAGRAVEDILKRG